MRTKNEIIGHLFVDVKKGVELGSLAHLTDVPLLEVLIDIRDMLDNRLLEIDRDIANLLNAFKEAK